MLDTEVKQRRVIFDKPIVVYIPAHNCEKTIGEALAGIPEDVHDKIECLIIDNFSSDRTSEVVKGFIPSRRFPFKIHLVRTRQNIGYAGSQKLAYSLVRQASSVQYVIMLHGDGQYPPQLVSRFIAECGKGYALVNGYRDKNSFPKREETPWPTYLMIKALSVLESLLTGCRQKEWHSGYVMYSKEFLKKVPLALLSDIPHIDGEFLMLAGILKEPTQAVPIYKKYREYEAFGGMARVRHVLTVFKMVFRFRLGHYRRILISKPAEEFDFKFDII